MEGHRKKAQRVVVIGASAGGIDALRKVLSQLPADLPAAMLMVQHLKEDYTTLLHEHLTSHCPLRIYLAQDGLPLEEGVVYLAVPGQHLLIENNHLILNQTERVNYVRPSADVLFASAAQAFGPHVVGVILSGTGRDGARGCQEIKKKGGTTIAQDEQSSAHFAMPRAAIKLGVIDYVLPLREIAEKITALVQGNRK